jgi:peptidoglycan/LPS O-acetylase OafA/YrhL
MNSLTSRNQSLDVLRGAAILLVLFDHYANVDRSFTKLGAIGVDLFFVLSGFLISGLLFFELRKTGAIRMGRFLLRRGLKIYPAFYVFLFFTSPIVNRMLPSFKWRLADEVFFLQPYRNHIWEHTWSLGVEEHFYLLLPVFLLVLTLARRLHFIPWIALALVFLCSMGRVLTAYAPSNTHLRIDELFDGVSLGYLLHYRSSVFQSIAGRRWLLPVGLLLLVPWFAGDVERIGGIQSLRITSAALGFSAIVWWSQGVVLRNRIVELIGRHSYSIYLWHMPIALFWNIVSPMNFIGFALCCGSSIGAGILMAKIVEWPVLKWRDKVFPSGAEAREQLGPARMSNTQLVTTEVGV